MADSLQELARLIAAALPNTSDLGIEETGAVLEALGWERPPVGADLDLGGLDLPRVLDALAELDLAVSLSTDTGVDIGVHAKLFTEVLELFDRLETVAAGLPVRLAAAGDYVATTDIAAQLMPRLVDFLVIRAIERQVPALYVALVATGVFRVEPWPPEAAKHQIGHLHHAIDLGRLRTLLTDPTALVHDLYGWSTPRLDTGKLVAAFGGLLQSFGLPASLSSLPPRVEARLTGLPVPPTDPLPRVAVSLLRAAVRDGPDVGLVVHGLRPSTPGGADGGIAFTPFVRGSTQSRFVLGPDLALDVQGVTEVLRGLAVLVRPGGAVQVKGGILAGGPLSAVTVPVGLRLTIGGEKTQPLLALPGGSRLEYRAVTVALGVRPGRSAAPQTYVEVGLVDARFVLDVSGAGTLVRELLPTDGVHAELDLGIGWADGRAYVHGSADLRASFPVHLSVGPVELETVAVALAPGAAGGIPIEVAATVRAVLGPLSLLVDGIGLTAALDLPAGGGNVGPFQLDLRFRPPTGIGASLDAGPVTGGGYLAVDPSGNRYAGGLQFKLTFVSITAFGIYEMTPGGATSFIAVLGVRFQPGIQLGFGFALTGVGGLVGMNRRANVDLLRERLASGAAGNVLFCDNPVANSPTLLGDLEGFFPEAEGSFIVGPTLQISWLAPIVRLDVAILLELPGPSKIVILGSIKVLIGANETMALLYLRMDFLGVLDFEQRLVSLDAYLVNSHALGVFRLTGGMAFRLSYGANPYILLSIGGFHPRFDPGPLNLPVIPRVGAVLGISVVAEVYLRLELYVAFTSNTLQLGAKVEAGLELGPISAHGYLQFDALIQFRPFAFDIEFAAGFSIEVFDVSLCSVDVRGRLTGPGPLVVHAEATVRLLFVKVSGSATVELGGKDGDAPQLVPSLIGALEPELHRDANLRTEGSDPDILLRSDQPVSGLLVSPRGQLIWEQKKVPLQTLVDRFEGAPLIGQHELALSTTAAGTITDERDWFSPGTFTALDLKSSQTMNNAAFQELPSGIRVGAARDAAAPTPLPYTPKIDLIKRPTRAKLLKQAVGSYLTGPLAAALAERDSTPPVLSGPSKVAVTPETFDVMDGAGSASATGQSPFQAFQLSRLASNLIAVPSADVVVAL